MDNEQLKKTLIFNVMEFLSNEAKSLITDEKRESIVVAIQCLENAFEISPDDRRILTKIDLLNHIGVVSQGITEEQLDKAEEYKNLGNTAMKNGEFEEALVQYSKAVESNPRNAIYFCNRAAAYSRLENNEEAIKDCKQALILDPSYGKAYGRLGIAYSNLNKWAEAVQAYENSIRLDPHNANYQTNLKLAKEKLVDSVEGVTPQQHRPIDISQFVNNDAFLTMATEMMSNPDFQNVLSRIMVMNQSGDANFEALLQAGQNLAAQMQDQDPRLVENLRRQFDPIGQNEPRERNDQNPGGES